MKENVKDLRHWPFLMEFTGDRWNPSTKGQQRWKCSHSMKSRRLLMQHYSKYRWDLGSFRITPIADQIRLVVLINTLRPRQNGRHFTDDIFKCIFLYENVWIPIWISLKFGPKGPINNIPALVQIMAWRRSGDKPLSEPMMVSLSTHICVIRPQWVNIYVTAISYRQKSNISRTESEHFNVSRSHLVIVVVQSIEAMC